MEIKDEPKSITENDSSFILSEKENDQKSGTPKSQSGKKDALFEKQKREAEKSLLEEEKKRIAEEKRLEKLKKEKEREIERAKKEEEKRKKEEDRNEEKRRKEEERNEEKRKRDEEKRIREEERLAKEAEKNEEKRKRDEEKRIKDEERLQKEAERNEEKRKRDEEKRKKDEEKKRKEDEVQRKLDRQRAIMNNFIKSPSAAKNFSAHAEPPQHENQQSNSDGHFPTNYLLVNSSRFSCFQVRADTRLAIPPSCREDPQNLCDDINDSGSCVVKENQNHHKQVSNAQYNRIDKFISELDSFPTCPSNNDCDDIIEQVLQEMRSIKPRKLVWEDPQLNGPAANQNTEIVRLKMFQFAENVRPAYFGSWHQKSSVIRPSRPFEQDCELIDYEVDSEQEWEQGAEDGENISGSEQEDDDHRADDEDEEERELKRQLRGDGNSGEAEEDEEDDEDDFIVPHGYLSDDEGKMSDDEDQQQQRAVGEEGEANLDPNERKLRQTVMGKLFEENLRRKMKPLRPKIVMDEIYLSQYRLALWSPEVPLEFPIKLGLPIENSANLDDSTIAGGASATSAAAEDGGETTPSSSKKFVFPTEAIPHLIRLVHRNGLSRDKLVFEFRMFWVKHAGGADSATFQLPNLTFQDELENRDWGVFTLSKTQLRIKIKQISSWQNNQNVVHDSEIDKFMPKEFDRSAPNSWNYVTDVQKSASIKKRKSMDESANKTPSKVRKSVSDYFKDNVHNKIAQIDSPSHTDY